MRAWMAVLALVVALLVVGCSGGATVSPDATATASPSQAPTSTPMAIPIVDVSKEYIVTIETEKGDLTLELFASDAPITVSNFVYLARQGFYDDTTFHRVIPGYVAQGGDPTGAGNGGPGYFIKDEITERTHVEGALSMANFGYPDTAGSQFFITYKAQPQLDGRYSVFGQLVSGMDVLEQLTPGDVLQDAGFVGDRVIRITVEER
jgi:cyclophilin family peptidyl-prolyl cis-trans isomerase